MILFDKLFYKNLLLKVFVILIITNVVFSVPYSSKFLSNNLKKSIKIYYSKNIQSLRKALKPRFIHYVASENYLKYRQIRVTGILFTYDKKEARNVFFASSIDNFKQHLMSRNTKGIWYYILSPKPYKEKIPNRKIRYRFLVDGSFENDINGDMEINADGNQISVYYSDETNFKRAYGALISRDKKSYQKKIIFRTKIKNTQKVSLIANFNHWNPKLDIMVEVADGVFEIKKYLPKGKYTYLYRVAGEYHIDNVNTQKKHHPVYGLVSYFEVK